MHRGRESADPHGLTAPEASPDDLASLAFLCCPYPDHGDLRRVDRAAIACESCGRQFPLVAGRPILLDETRSIFGAADIAKSVGKGVPDATGWCYRIRRALPAATSRDASQELLASHRHLLSEEPVVVVVGCGLVDDRYERLFPAGRIFLTDVTLRGDAMLACDGGCLPFRDSSVDCVVVDQVLEHAVDPIGIVAEIRRCLRVGGIVYSGVPFCAPVHGFPYDFQRYTPLGHRLLFGGFEELEFRITQGAVSTLSLTLLAFLAGLWDNLGWRRLASAGVRLLLGPLRRIEHRRSGSAWATIPGASAFLGRKCASEESRRALIASWSARGGAAAVPRRA